MALTKVSYSMITGASVNVLDYGAFNDNTNQAATTAAIQAAINTGKNVYFPQGQYAINAELTVFAAGQRLFGDARGNTQILQNTVTANGIVVDGKNDVQIENLFLVANGTNTKAGLLVKNGCINSAYSAIKITNFKYGVQCLNSNQASFTQFILVDNLTHGMYLAGIAGNCIDTIVIDSYFAGNGASGTGNNLYVEGSVSGIWFTKVALQIATGFGIYMEKGAGTNTPNAGFFTQCICDQNVSGGVKMVDGFLMEFNNCWVSGLGDGYSFESAVADIRIIGGEVFNMGGHGVKILGTRCSVVGTNIRGAGYTAVNTYDSIRLEASTATLISGVNFDGEYNSVNTTRYGVSLKSGGGINNTYVTGCVFSFMASGNYINEGGATTNNVFLEQYQGGSASIADLATATLYTFPSQLQGTYLFFAGQTSNANGGIRAMALVRVGTGSLAVSSIVAAGGATLSGTGFAVQITNTAGGAVVFDYSWIKL
jgi:hypothetical protein